MTMSEAEKFNRALDLFIESLHKPDHELRNDAREFGGLNELLRIRDLAIVFCSELRK